VDSEILFGTSSLAG